MMTRLQTSLIYLILVIAALLTIYPLLFALFNSFMTDAETVSYPPNLLPSRLNWENYKEVILNIPVVTFVFNSFIVSTAIMVGQLIIASLSAYAFAYLKFRGKTVLFTLFLSTMMIPWEVTMIPNYLTIRSWDWIDTYQGLIVPFLATAFGTFLLRQFFLQLPNELFEAAKIDGCSHLRSFFSLVLPLSRPALAALGVYSFLNHWNMYLWPLLITNTVDMRTVQIGVSMLKNEESASWNLVFAGVVVVLLPTLALLVLGLNQLVSGITKGAVKG
ncbi:MULTISPECIES: carbohydrate ABC transporter permease [unclassified Paenibacillus]|uniref:carbohydrate ABC transporter permease n=1 Tax=unclassified Paenibacillus TaxID=185978 RepID=UPI00363E25B7